MTAVLAILSALRKLPQWAWGVIIFLALAGGVWWLHVRSVEIAVLNDRREQAALARAELDSLRGAEQAKARWAVEAAEARSRAAWASRDSAVARTRAAERALARSQARVSTALTTLPDSLRRIPAVDSLVRACTALARDCEQLRATVVTERAAADTARAEAQREMRARVVLQQITDTALARAAVVITDRDRTIAAQRGRLSKQAALAWYAVLRGSEWLITSQLNRRTR